VATIEATQFFIGRVVIFAVNTLFLIQ